MDREIEPSTRHFRRWPDAGAARDRPARGAPAAPARRCPSAPAPTSRIALLLDDGEDDALARAVPRRRSSTTLPARATSSTSTIRAGARATCWGATTRSPTSLKSPSSRPGERPRRDAASASTACSRTASSAPCIFLLLMGAVFQSVFAWAQPAMDLIDAADRARFGRLVEPRCPTGRCSSLLVDGIIAGVGTTLTFVPQIAILFLFISLLEDTGYMARAAFIMDRIMGKVGLSGRAFIPLLSSFACAIPGIMATRTHRQPARPPHHDHDRAVHVVQRAAAGLRAAHRRVHPEPSGSGSSRCRASRCCSHVLPRHRRRGRRRLGAQAHGARAAASRST